MKYTVLAPISKNTTPLYVGIKEFPTTKLILFVSSRYEYEATIVKKDLEKFRIPITLHKLEKDTWEEIFHAIHVYAAKENAEELLINVGAADSSAKCAATCAGFVNGIKAFDVMDDEVMMLPVLKFSYYTLLNETKLSLMKILMQNKEGLSLQRLAQKAKMSPPLVSYHVHGTKKVDGLKQFGLIEVVDSEEKGIVKINMLGTLLIKGYV